MNPTATPSPRPRRGIAFQLAAVALVVVSALAATGLARWLREPTSKPADVQTPKFPGRLFRDWDKPDFVVVLSGQQHGYLNPCGCSSPQIGGLERRYNLLQMLKKNGWPVVAVDLGDIPQASAPAKLPNQQAMIKYLYSMKALAAMGYSAVAFGENEVKLGLFQVLGEYAINEPKPRVISTNLMDPAKYELDKMIAPWEPVDVKEADVRVGVVAVTDPLQAAKLKELTRNDPSIRFGRTDLTLQAVTKQLADSKVQLPVLLYQGPLTRNARRQPSTGAIACAEDNPQFPLVLCLSEEDDPSVRPEEVTTKTGTKSLVLSVGHKGKYLGVVGVWKTGDKAAPFQFKYERVEMSEDFLTAKDKHKDHPIVALLEEYAKKLREDRYLERYSQIRHALQVMPEVPNLKNSGEVTYAGSEACKKCHEHAYDVWKKSGHAHAYQTLVDKKFPSNAQYDPECIVCHTVGFGYQSGFVTADKTPKLKDVGCESCHGPASLHVKNPTDAEWQKRINPWPYLPKEKRAGAIDQMCQKCHDQENDVTWTNDGFKRKWPKVEHVTPGKTDE